MQVISSEKFPIKVWTDIAGVEEAAIKQAKNAANLPFVFKHVALMPDIHHGYGVPVGSVIATIGAIVPAKVGVDIGCGMLAAETNLTANDLPDSLKAVRHNIERQIPVGDSSYKDESHLREEETQHIREAGHVFNTAIYYDIFQKARSSVGQQLGTLGGGNHFIELCLDERDKVWIMLHTGSRGVGKRIGERYMNIAREEMAKYFIDLPDKELSYLPKDTKHFEDYVSAVSWAQEYAKLNRKVMIRRIVECLKYDFPQLEVDLENRVVQCHHNYIAKEHHFKQNVLVTRKGAVRAREGDIVIIPGSMGTKSYIGVGLGNPQSFHSCSHGAGRRMSRTLAKETFTLEDHAKATEGVECRKDEKVLDETPGAYKNLDEVMENQKDLVKPLHTLKAVLCVKGN